MKIKILLVISLSLLLSMMAGCQMLKNRKPQSVGSAAFCTNCLVKSLGDKSAEQLRDTVRLVKHQTNYFRHIVNLYNKGEKTSFEDAKGIHIGRCYQRDNPGKEHLAVMAIHDFEGASNRLFQGPIYDFVEGAQHKKLVILTEADETYLPYFERLGEKYCIRNPKYKVKNDDNYDCIDHEHKGEDGARYSCTLDSAISITLQTLSIKTPRIEDHKGTLSSRINPANQLVCSDFPDKIPWSSGKTIVKKVKQKDWFVSVTYDSSKDIYTWACYFHKKVPNSMLKQLLPY